MSKTSTPLLLLDTHVWIWLLNGSPELKSSNHLLEIEKAMKHSSLRISAISVWEIGMLEAKGRIRFKMDCLEWVQQALSAPGTILTPLSPEIAIESSRLPGNFHGDPADRIIVATARHLHGILVTQDKNILNYGKLDYVKVLEV